LHGAKQFNGALLADQGGSGFALGQGRQETGLDVGGFVNAWWNAFGDQVYYEFLVWWRWFFQLLDQACGLFGVKRLGNDTQCCTLFDMFAVGFKHSITLISGPKWVSGTLIPKLPYSCTARRCESFGQNYRQFLTEAAFKVLRLQNGELMRVGVGLSPLERPFANTVLKERLCS
jgi:hypothetical protein